MAMRATAEEISQEGILLAGAASDADGHVRGFGSRAWAAGSSCSDAGGRAGFTTGRQPPPPADFVSAAGYAGLVVDLDSQVIAFQDEAAEPDVGHPAAEGLAGDRLDHGVGRVPQDLLDPPVVADVDVGV